jgi:hypothetical protein
VSGGVVENRPRADLREHRGVERIGRHRDEHFVAGPASAVSASSMPSDVPAVMTTRSGSSGMPRRGTRRPPLRAPARSRPTARSRCGRRGWPLDRLDEMRRRVNPKMIGSPMFRYRTFRPGASTLRASATMLRMA